MKYWKVLITIIVLFLLSVYLGKKPINLPKLSKFPEFKLSTQDNQEFTEKNLLGHKVIFSFFFTSCEGPCPTLNAELAKIQKEFAADKDLIFVSVTIDPDRDSSEKLKEYITKVSANPSNWFFLTGNSEDIVKLSEGGLGLGLDPAIYVHSTKVVLIDKESYIRGLFDSQDKNELKTLKKSLNSL